MPMVDWRSSEPYERLQMVDAPTFAGEFLDRNQEFHEDVRRLIREHPESGPQDHDDDDHGDAFESRWGCMLGPELLASPLEPRWTFRALPSKLLIIATPPRLRTALPLRLTRTADAGTRTSSVRFEVEEAGPAGPCSVVIPLDQLLDVRLAAVRQLAADLAGKPTLDPFALTPARRGRLIQALRALDGRQGGAAYRAIAAALFGQAAVPERAWKTHDLRDRTIRLVRYGEALMRGGYRQLLNHRQRSLR